MEFRNKKYPKEELEKAFKDAKACFGDTSPSIGKYVRITPKNGTSYIKPLTELKSAIGMELDCLGEELMVTLKIEMVEMTDEEYWKLIEFKEY